MPDSATRARPHSASQGRATTVDCPPINSHSSTNCSICSRKAAIRLDMSQRPAGLMMRRSGITIQSDSANTSCPTGLPKGTRWACMYMRSRQTPVNRPTTTSSKKETI